MSWEQEITEQLQHVQNVAARFDIVQQLTEEQEGTAKSNIGIGVNATNVSNDDYRIDILY